MATIHITGGRPLHGSVGISGSKNGSLPVLAASLLLEGDTLVENVPDIEDVRTMIQVLRALGAEVEFKPGGRVRINSDKLTSTTAPDALVRQMRASFYVAGPLLARYGEAQVPLPGGCVIGRRPVDFHIAGFQSLGASVRVEHGWVRATARRLSGARIFLDPRYRSAGATNNLMMAACLARGRTIIENASREPETQDCAAFLVEAGAKIQGIGGATLVVDGVERLQGCRHAVIPDRMEAGTMLLAAAVTQGDVRVEGVNVGHLEPLTRVLRQAGMEVQTNGDWVRLCSRGRLHAFDVTTAPYPGFPTDMQPGTVVLMCLAEGTSHMEETIFDARYGYTDELRRMGADVRVIDQLAIVRGVKQLSGAPVEAPDIRAGAGLVVAGLAAEGETVISQAELIDRGYENLVEKLAGLGAAIARPADRAKLCLA